MAPLPRPPYNKPPVKPRNSDSLFRYFFPHIRSRFRDHLQNLRYNALPRWKHNTQSSIYQALVRRQLKKQQRKAKGLLSTLRQRSSLFWGRGALKDGRVLRKGTMAYRGPPSRSYEDDGLSDLRAEGREPGGRRKKIAGYLRAANELRQSYTQSWGTRAEEGARDIPGSFPDAAVASTGDEELIVFPSYARRHVKVEPPTAIPGSIQEVSGTGRDYRDTVGAGDAEFWKEQWEKHENDKAIIDVDVRGWIFTPLKGQLTRKQRLMVALARQLVGLPAPIERSSSKNSSRSSSPVRTHQTLEEEQAAREAAAIIPVSYTHLTLPTKRIV